MVAGAVDDPRPVPHDWDREKTRILAANTAQGVHKHLRILESNRSRVLPRWIWELLQNARDVSDGNGSLIASVEVRDRELTFCHNGRGFQPEEITHLIYYGSTKLERDDAVGQFGSGFLTTHLLSSTIEVSGYLTDGRRFAFPLDRGGDSVADLQRRMDDSFEAFKFSLAHASDGSTPRATTTFRYPIDERASEAVRKGVQALELTGFYVTAVNREFRRIQIVTADSAIGLALGKRHVLAECIEEVEVNVSAHESKSPVCRSLIVAEFDGVAVAIPCKHSDGELVLESPTSVPKLLLGFPLIGTEDFSFPAVVHSLRFSPTEERDGVYLGQSDDQVNHENQAVIEQACQLLLSIVGFAAKSNWARTYLLADIPPVHAERWLNKDWLRNCLKTNLVDPIRATPSILTESGSAVASTAATLPMADSPEAVDRLWSLAYALTALKDSLPRQAEAQGWCNAARSWAALYDCPQGQLGETMDGRDLARHAASAESIEALQAEVGDGDATCWLDGLYSFLSDSGFDNALRDLSIVPDQNGRFSTLRKLHRDRDIPTDLKEIARLVSWDLRAELRDTRFGTLVDEIGAGDVDSDFVIRELIDRLRERMEDTLDDDFKAASVRVFGWLTVHGHWRYLEGFPAFFGETASSNAMKLVRHENDASERPLAPVRTWPETLRQYADLFPRRHIMAEDFAEGIDDSSVWAELDQRGFLCTSVLYTRAETFDAFLPDEPLPDSDNGEVEHKVDDVVEVTDVAFLSRRDIGILSRVRQSRSQAQLFWDFLTRWLAVEDAQGLEAREAMCVCGSPHHYYPAAWLVPVMSNQWVPLERKRADRVSAHSLANLVRDSKWPAELLRPSPQGQVVALLKALRVGVPELIMELVTTDDEEREALDETLAKLLTSVGNEWNRLQVLAEDIQDDGGLFDHLEERRQRRRTVRENQRLGALVEDLVRESLEDEGFDVHRTGIGSDFAIQPMPIAEDEQILLELTRRGRTWLVEIKSTRDDGVKMTSVQARTAVEHDPDYLLCVVPISPESEDPDNDAVRRCMRFVDGVGPRLTGICTDLDDFESFRDIVTVEGTAGFRLELDSGSPRVRVGSTVWENGFGLEKLFDRLTTADDGRDGGVGY